MALDGWELPDSGGVKGVKHVFEDWRWVVQGKLLVKTEAGTKWLQAWDVMQKLEAEP